MATSTVLSRELQIGKAAEHLVVADLILSGYNAFLTDAGLNFDVVCEIQGRLRSVQVKATRKPQLTRRAQTESYIFGLKNGRSSRQIPKGIDIFAFVALDLKVIAYVPAADITRNGRLIQAIEFRAPGVVPTRRYHNGTLRVYESVRYIHKFPISSVDIRG